MSDKKTKGVPITFKKFLEIVNRFNNLDTIFQASKLGLTIVKFIDVNRENVFTDYNLELSTIRINNALTDKNTGAVLTKKDDNRGFEYDKAGFIGVIKEENELEKKWNEREFLVTPVICTDPHKISDTLKELLTGYVI